MFAAILNPDSPPDAPTFQVSQDREKIFKAGDSALIADSPEELLSLIAQNVAPAPPGCSRVFAHFRYSTEEKNSYGMDVTKTLSTWKGVEESRRRGHWDSSGRWVPESPRHIMVTRDPVYVGEDPEELSALIDRYGSLPATHAMKLEGGPLYVLQKTYYPGAFPMVGKSKNWRANRARRADRTRRARQERGQFTSEEVGEFLNLLSEALSVFQTDYGLRSPAGDQWPGSYSSHLPASPSDEQYDSLWSPMAQRLDFVDWPIRRVLLRRNRGAWEAFLRALQPHIGALRGAGRARSGSYRRRSARLLARELLYLNRSTPRLGTPPRENLDERTDDGIQEQEPPAEPGLDEDLGGAGGGQERHGGDRLGAGREAPAGADRPAGQRVPEAVA